MLDRSISVALCAIIASIVKVKYVDDFIVVYINSLDFHRDRVMLQPFYLNDVMTLSTHVTHVIESVRLFA